MRVIDGGLTRSIAASSPSVSSPDRRNVPSTDNWLSERSSLERSSRIRRARRITLDAQRAREALVAGGAAFVGSVTGAMLISLA